MPVIMLNGADAPRGRLFSLLHEYVHLLLHTEGLCDVSTDLRATSENRQFEARCNAIAAEILMPSASVLALPAVIEHRPDEPWKLHELLVAARPFGVSAESFLRRLVTLGKATLSEYQTFRATQAPGGPTREKVSGGSFYYNKARDLGKGYVRTVAGAHSRALIDSSTAAEYLDVKVGQIPRLAEVSGA
jgi:Zn-dependent peptidase ImmA (M78 family)